MGVEYDTWGGERWHPLPLLTLPHRAGSLIKPSSTNTSSTEQATRRHEDHRCDN